MIVTARDLRHAVVPRQHRIHEGIPPVQQIQNRPVDMRTDIYALGITLYQMLSGHVPFESDSDFEIMNCHITAPPPPLTRMYPYAPVQYENVVMKALEKNPDNRYQTVEQFGVALEHPESVPAPGAVATPPGVRPTMVEMPKVPMVAGSAALAAAAPAPAYATAPQMQAVPAASVPSAPAASPATEKITWNSRYTVAAAVVAAALILLAVLIFGRKPPVAQTPGLIAPASSPSAESPLPSQQAEVTVTGPNPLGSPGSSQSQGQGSSNAPASPPPSSQPPPQRSAKPRETPSPESAVLIPGGTPVVVRTIDPIDSNTAAAGQHFNASVDEPVVVGDHVVVAKHADAVLEIAGMKKGGHIRGRAELSIQLVSLKVRGRNLPVQTEVHSAQGPSRGSNTAKKAGGAGAAGAVLGGILGGGKGALAGGAIGVGGAMAFQLATHGSRVQIPSESRLEFVTTQDASFSNAAAAEGPSEIDELEHQVDQLSSRAAAVNNSLDRLQRQQAAAGYGLRGDIASRQASMQSNLSKAESAVQSRDVARAKRYISLTAADLEILEKFLGR